MRSPVRLNVAVSLLAISFAIACSDSTGPREPTAAQVAAHFDSIAIDAQAQAETHSSYSTRNLISTLIELPAALGATPASVNVTTANGVVFGCTLDPAGHMYALDGATGNILWSFASGGGCLSGAAISEGRLFWGSGYSFFSTPNNKLYSFGLPG